MIKINEIQVGGVFAIQTAYKKEIECFKIRMAIIDETSCVFKIGEEKNYRTEKDLREILLTDEVIECTNIERWDGLSRPYKKILVKYNRDLMGYDLYIRIDFSGAKLVTLEHSLKYLHQLQNLYSALLIREELKIDMDKLNTIKL